MTYEERMQRLVELDQMEIEARLKGDEKALSDIDNERHNLPKFEGVGIENYKRWKREKSAG